MKLTLNDYRADVEDDDEIHRDGKEWYVRTKVRRTKESFHYFVLSEFPEMLKTGPLQLRMYENKEDDYALIFLDRPVTVCEEDDPDTLLV